MRLVNQLSADVKTKYYVACGVVEKKLMLRGYARLNNHQCRYICEHLAIGKKMQMKALKSLSDGKVAPPRPPSQPPHQQSLFD